MASYLGNAFSLQMLTHLSGDVKISRSEIRPEEVAEDAKSCIGHPDTANIVSSILGRKVETARVSVALNPGDILYVAQYIGPRLPEGCTKLPEGAEMKFYKITIS